MIAFTAREGSNDLLVIAYFSNSPYPDGYVIQSSGDRLLSGGWQDTFNRDAGIYGGADVGNFGASSRYRTGGSSSGSPRTASSFCSGGDPHPRVLPDPGRHAPRRSDSQAKSAPLPGDHLCSQSVLRTQSIGDGRHAQYELLVIRLFVFGVLVSSSTRDTNNSRKYRGIANAIRLCCRDGTAIISRYTFGKWQ